MSGLEVLIIVRNGESEWWQDLVDGEDILLEGGRGAIVTPDRALTVARMIRLQGYHALIVCPDEETRKAIDRSMPLNPPQLDYLVGSRDSAQIRALLTRPSAHALRLFFSDQLNTIPPAYVDIIREAATEDPYCRAFGEAFTAAEWKITDFEIAAESDADVILQWQYDPGVRLKWVADAIDIVNPEGLKIRPCVIDQELIRFEDGHADLLDKQINYLLEYFDLNPEFEDWVVPQESRLPPAIAIPEAQASESVSASLLRRLEQRWRNPLSAEVVDLQEWYQWIAHYFGGQTALAVKSDDSSAPSLLVVPVLEGELWCVHLLWGADNPPCPFEFEELSLFVTVERGDERPRPIQLTEDAWQHDGRRLALPIAGTSDQSASFGYTWDASEHALSLHLKLPIDV